MSLDTIEGPGTEKTHGLGLDFTLIERLDTIRHNRGTRSRKSTWAVAGLFIDREFRHHRGTRSRESP
jgi:hypothetical protein